MKSKLFETVALSGNGVVNKKGSDSCLVIYKGAGKLQTCGTADGVFEDFATLEDKGGMASVFVDISGAKNFLQVTGADFSLIVFGDLNIEPASIVPVGDVVGKLHAYSFTDSDDDFLIYTKDVIKKAGTITIYTPEADTTYGYVLTKGTLKIEDVDEDGVLTDDSAVEYTPDTDSDIEL